MITCGKFAPFRQIFIAETADGPADIMVNFSAFGMRFALRGPPICKEGRHHGKRA